MKKLFYAFIFLLGFTFLFNADIDAQTKKPKKHWSHKKKDAVIGAGAGAATGAIVSKHHVKGAVIGGAVGAGAGYVVGKKKDKKEAKKK